MSYARMTEQAVNRTSGRGDFFIPAEKTTQTSGTLTERLPHAVAGRRQSRAVSSEEDVPRQEVECSIRNYTRTANMLVDGYSELLPQEKWLYVCLVRLCGKEGSRFLSLRYIAERTGFSLGVLSASKKSMGMLWKLHQAGLIHAEIKKQVLRDGKETQHAQFYITILDVWQKNEAFFSGAKRSDSEQFVNVGKRSVRYPNALCSESERCDRGSVQNLNGNCSESATRVRLQGKITDSSKITEEADPSNSSSLESEHAAAVVFVLETMSEEEIALIQDYRQGMLKVSVEPSENLGEPTSAPVENKQTEIIAQETSTEAVEHPGVSGEEQASLTRPTAITTAEVAVQVWEQIRGVRYEQRERVMQLRAATALLGMELARPLTPELLETLYSTYYDDFWKKKYGELHVTHLVEVEKSSGQVRVARWVKRLGFQALPARSSGGPAEKGTAGAQETFVPTMDFANYRQEEERDLVGDYAAGKMTEKELAGFSPGMLDVLKRHAAARMAATGGVR